MLRPNSNCRSVPFYIPFGKIKQHKLYLDRNKYFVNLEGIHFKNPSDDFYLHSVYLFVGEFHETLILDRYIMDMFSIEGRRDTCVDGESKPTVSYQIPSRKLGYWNTISPKALGYDLAGVRVEYRGTVEQIYLSGCNIETTWYELDAITNDRLSRQVRKFDKREIFLDKDKSKYTLDKVYGKVHGLFVHEKIISLFSEGFINSLFIQCPPPIQYNGVVYTARELSDDSVLNYISLNYSKTGKLIYIPLDGNNDFPSTNLDTATQITPENNDKYLIRIGIELDKQPDFSRRNLPIYVYKTVQLNYMQGLASENYTIEN